MVRVISDDFTGAAEIGGIAWRHGLEAQIVTSPPASQGFAVSVFDTETRHETARAAAQKVRDTARHLPTRSAVLTYKKTDSVLRGNVLAELIELQEVLRKSRVLLVPANPSLGRVIRDGLYFVNGVPLEKTEFARDPLCPVTSSRVVEILGAAKGVRPTWVDRSGVDVPDTGVIVADTVDEDDLERWASVVDENTLPAGAGEFFSSILRRRLGRQPKAESQNKCLSRRATVLFVGGSYSEYSRRFSAWFSRQNWPVHSIPAKLAQTDELQGGPLSQWVNQTVESFYSGRIVRISIDLPQGARFSSAQHLTDCLTLAVESILQQRPIDYVLVEGGTTAYQLTRLLGWHNPRLQSEWSPGVVALSTANSAFVLVSKPGTYNWPDRLLKTLAAD